jgi:adenylate cyclase
VPWGDTVTVASRMESHSEADRIHVTTAFADALAGTFTLVERGVTEAKGVGAVRTFWLEG